MTAAAVVFIAIVVAGTIAAGLIRARARQREQLQAERRRQRAFIDAYVFPGALAERLRAEHPSVSPDDVPVVLEGLREFFLACLSAEDAGIARNVGMPSKIVDDAWHEFLLMTREYHAFCDKAFGHYLHHTPRSLMPEPHDDALANTLHQLKRPETLIAGTALGASVPRLFTLDRELNVAGGFRYDDQDLSELEHRRRAIVGGGGSDGGGGGCAVATVDGASSCGHGGCGGGGS